MTFHCAHFGPGGCVKGNSKFELELLEASMRGLCRFECSLEGVYLYPLNDYNSYYGHLGGCMTKRMATWAVAKAKAKLSAVIDQALAEGPQTITRNGRKAVVVVSVEEWERKAQRKGNLAEFFAASPLSGSRLRIRRSNAKPREVAL